jgi:hypothetical protein
LVLVVRAPIDLKPSKVYGAGAETKVNAPRSNSQCHWRARESENWLWERTIGDEARIGSKRRQVENVQQDRVRYTAAHKEVAEAVEVPDNLIEDTRRNVVEIPSNPIYELCNPPSVRV